MEINKTIPSLEDFMNAPIDIIRPLSPKTAVICVGGTRRSAALEGIEPHSKEFVDWSRPQLIKYMDMLFDHGIENIIAAAVISPNIIEFESYRQRFLQMVHYGLANDSMIKDYIDHDWKVRIIGSNNIPELTDTANILKQRTTTRSKKSLWWITTPYKNSVWDEIIQVALSAGSKNRSDIINSIYGEHIPPATILIGNGKPVFMYDLIPPLLIGKLECYWYQRPGYRLDQDMLRKILYDFLYLRNNAPAKIHDEYTQLDSFKHIWNSDNILGVGEKLGPFWYPSALMYEGENEQCK